MHFLVIIVTVSFFFSSTVDASQAASNKAFVPDNDFVVGKWNNQKNTDLVKNSQSPEVIERGITRLLHQAKYMGNSQNYVRAKNLLSQIDSTQSSHSQFIYYDAVIQQHYHNFKKSLLLLQQVLDEQPEHANALLLSSNLYAVQGNFERAKQVCASLTGMVEPILVAACKLNIDAQEGGPEDIEIALATLTKFNQQFPSKNLETATYVTEIQASLANYVGQSALANDILTPYMDKKLPVSFWVLWADVQINMAQAQNVLNTLGPLVEQTQNKDDALLLRLAIAEKTIQAKPLKWLPLVKERVELRMLRQDEEHAFDIALYYMHFTDEPKKAYSWALTNWQQAKLQEDSRLLITAKNMANGGTE